MKFRSAFAVLSMTVALAACGQLPFQKAAETAPAPAAAGHSGPPAVSPLQQPIETGTTLTPVAVAEASTMNTAMFRATGSGWAVTADSKNAVLERTGAKSVGISVRRLTYARGVEFIGTLNGNVFSLNLQAEACRDGDVMTPFTARLRMGTQRLSGCAAATETMPKAQTRASSAPPKPKNQPKPAKPAAPATPATTTPVPPALATAAPATPAPAATAPATPTPVTTAPATPAPAPTATTPATPAMPSTSTPAPAGVPAPQLVLPPTPPAPSQ